jgi:hypothetical protein
MHLLILPCRSIWPHSVVTQELLSGFSYCDYIKVFFVGGAHIPALVKIKPQ